MDEIVNDFLIESNENLDRLDQELVKLESSPSSRELLASIFRTIHTIKGSCGFLGFARLEKLTHAGESLLSQLRDGKLALTAEITNGLLSMVDAVRHILAVIQSTARDGEDDHAELIAHLGGLQNQTTANPPEAADESSTTTAAAHPLASDTAAPAAAAGQLADPGKLGGVLLERGQVRPEDLMAALKQQEQGRKRIGEILVEQGAAKPEDVQAAQKTVEARNPDAVETIRVGVNLLDRLMNLVGELVLARNQLLQFSSNRQAVGFQAVSQRVNLIATELQEEVMKTRMQPIGNVWDKFPRTVRDLALNCGKEVRLEMEGQDTELDRAIVQAIKDPMTHLVRNCVDHGIETPEIRKRAGKEPVGILKVRAFHEGGRVNIDVTDDGAGLNAERIRQKAVERGLVTSQAASRVADRDVFNLIFLPGVSTAEKVTKVSGRGVGMDVVKTNVERIGGTVDVQSTAGQGTTVRMKIPLTLAIIPALIVTTAADRYAVPQVNLLEVVRLEGERARTAIEQVGRASVYRLRGKLLPLIYLERELQADIAAAVETSTRVSPTDATHDVNIVVLRADDREFGLVVDAINDTQEIVVKSLGKQLKSINAYTGATILGDGRVALILDVLGLAQRANLICRPAKKAVAEIEVAAHVAGKKDRIGGNAFLLFQCGEVARMAVDLRLVARLEDFPENLVEMAGGREVVQYRGQIMPLIRVSETLARARRAVPDRGHESFQVVVYSESSRTIGLVVDRILDVVEESFAIQWHTRRKGILGSAVIQEHATDILDVPGLIAGSNLSPIPSATPT